MADADLGDLLSLSWADFDALRNAGMVESNAKATFIESGMGGNVGCEPATVRTHEGTLHLCGPKCEHLKLDDYGGYVCTLTGITFGQQITGGQDRTLGSPRGGMAGLDEEFGMGISPTPSRATPSNNLRKRRRNAGNCSHEEIFSSCTQTVANLMKTEARRKNDVERLEKALKFSARSATARREHEPCALKLLFHAYAEVERCGAVSVNQTMTDRQLDILALLLAQLYHAVIAPYSVINSKRPTNTYYAVGMCYLLATHALGERLHVPALTRLLPEEKSLKALNIIVSRVTAAKRYCLAAVKHFVVTHNAKKTAK